MRKFTELKVWQKSHELVLDVYALTRSFPGEERYGITAQVRRTSASVPANIAEGSKLQSRRELARFVNIAEGSCAETRYLLTLARDLRHADGDAIDPLLSRLDGLAGMLYLFRTKLEASSRAAGQRLPSDS